MAPPTQTFNLDVEAISGICGSISIACWVVVFSPQIIQNFQRSSADALSVQFIIVWLLGDVFNILGAVLQHVLPTMIILAVYYTIADIVLLAQCFYYRGFTWRDEPTPAPPKPTAPAAREPDEYTQLLAGAPRRERRGSNWSGLSPAASHVPEMPSTPPPPPTAFQTIAWNATIVLMVCAAGILGWFLGEKAKGKDKEASHGGEETLVFSPLGQFFGYLCAVSYIASRLPQLILNWRRKTTEGLSMLFFLFACLGNITYVLSIFAYEPRCREHTCEPGEASRIYGKYILVNLSWLAGSLVTLLLDLGVFAQYFMYQTRDEEQEDDEFEDESEHRDIGEDRWDQRPILQRDDSSYR
ncbi:PQ loop repeat-domain-containing protein [Stachybotrys elegans]|uniref:PQ loop repeat-domain-containing protein n=1 Tax=Stachybotrys elegans TaxID=80388 RepID=A0A8K0SYK0_9HYPO|nr:PQ loop repeat-domain-containing protein [Stachybotrys elegans]